MTDKDIQQPQGWKQRMIQVAAGIFAPYAVPLQALTTTITNVAASATNVTLKVANTSRRGLWVYNDSDASLYIKCGATATLSSYSVKVLPGGYWEMAEPIYTGIVDGIWTSDPTGSARITELS